jgi:hypothetical protein
MPSYISEKAWHLKKLHEIRDYGRELDTERSGLILKGESFSLTRLAALLVEIARATLEEIRCLAFVEELTSKLSAATDGMVVIGSADMNAMKAPAKTASLVALHYV